MVSRYDWASVRARSTRTRASAVRPAKARATPSSIWTILRAVRASCSLAADFFSAPAASGRSEGGERGQGACVSAPHGRARARVGVAGGGAAGRAGGAAARCPWARRVHFDGALRFVSSHVPSTTQSAPATPTAREPLRTASKAYSTWNLWGEREKRKEMEGGGGGCARECRVFFFFFFVRRSAMPPAEYIPARFLSPTTRDYAQVAVRREDGDGPVILGHGGEVRVGGERER